MGDRLRVAEPFGELERPLDVLARSLVVPLAPVAPRAPLEDVRAQPVTRKARALGYLERLRIQRQRRRDRRELVAAAGQPVEDLGAVEIAEPRLLDRLARRLEQRERRPNVTEIHPRPRLGERRADAELVARALEAGEEADRLLVARGLDRGLGLRDHALRAKTLAFRDSGLEELAVDAELDSQPLERLGGRPRLAALDLADVLLRAAVAGELRLGQAARSPQATDAVAQSRCGARVDGGFRGLCSVADLHVLHIGEV